MEWLLPILLVIIGSIVASEYAGWRLGRRIKKEVRKLVEDGNPKIRETIVNWGVQIFKGILESEEIRAAIQKELRKLGEELAEESDQR